MAGEDRQKVKRMAKRTRKGNTICLYSAHHPVGVKRGKPHSLPWECSRLLNECLELFCSLRFPIVWGSTLEAMALLIICSCGILRALNNDAEIETFVKSFGAVVMSARGVCATLCALPNDAALVWRCTHGSLSQSVTPIWHAMCSISKHCFFVAS